MNIDGHTRLLGLIGTPVGHSKSPAMYNYCFEKYGLNCAYLAFDVDMEHVEDAVAAIRTGRHYIGFEIDPTYCEIAEQRIREEVKHGNQTK